MVNICETLGDSLGGTLRNNQAQTTNTTKADTILSDIQVITPTITSIGLYFTGSKRSPFGESGSDYVDKISKEL